MLRRPVPGALAVAAALVAGAVASGSPAGPVAPDTPESGVVESGAVEAGAVEAVGAPAVLVRQGPVVVDGLTPPVAVRCSAGRATLTLTGRAAANRTLRYAAVLDGRTVRSGTLRTGNGTVSVTLSVRNQARHTASLTVAGRVLARTAAGRPVPAACPVPKPAAQPVPAPADGPAMPDRSNARSYAVWRNGNGTDARWDPCSGPVSVRVNTALAPVGALAEVRTALAAVTAATGLRFDVIGSTTFVPTTTNAAARPADLVVAWANRGVGAGRSDLYSTGAIAQGGWSSTGSSTDGGATWNWRINSGMVVVDPAATAALRSGFGSGRTRGSVLLHELGHVVGLQHVGDRGQTMYPSVSDTSSGSYGAGDRAGLRAVGATNGCTTAS